MVDDARCGLCVEPVKPGDKAMFKELPDKGFVRVHIICAVKARIQKIGKRRDPTPPSSEQRAP